MLLTNGSRRVVIMHTASFLLRSPKCRQRLIRSSKCLHHLCGVNYSLYFRVAFMTLGKSVPQLIRPCSDILEINTSDPSSLLAIVPSAPVLPMAPAFKTDYPHIRHWFRHLWTAEQKNRKDSTAV